MRVKEFINLLSNFDGELEIVFPNYGDGGGFDPIEGVEIVSLVDLGHGGNSYSGRYDRDDSTIFQERVKRKLSAVNIHD